jgi:hypothetical protein
LFREAFTVKSIVIGIGQRYTVIVNGLADPLAGGSNGKYWMRTHPADGCNTFRTATFNSQGSLAELFDIRTAYIRYSTATNDTELGEAGNYTHWMLRLPPDVEQAAAGREFHRPLWLDFGKPTLLDPTAAIATPITYTLRQTFPLSLS